MNWWRKEAVLRNSPKLSSWCRRTRAPPFGPANPALVSASAEHRRNSAQFIRDFGSVLDQKPGIGVSCRSRRRRTHLKPERHIVRTSSTEAGLKGPESDCAFSQVVASQVI